ncbi:hypothetical protein CBS101457_000602 [Exobasidium rhododendri]|nr:hypothetical protein CBS101457_000602 [Exobasidium rhododendri]
MATLTNGGQVGWQSLIRQRLEERDTREKAFDEIVDNYQRLARHAKSLRDRNYSMLQASTNVSNETKAGTIKAPSLASGPSASGGDQDNVAVKLAYFASVEVQLKTARDELSTLYKTQSQNAQKLISLNEQMREKDDQERDASEDTRRLNDEMNRIKRKVGDLRGVVDEKDKMIQMLQDELSALSLELNQVELRNDDLRRDNASLLQRWLDRMNDEAEKMNEGNRFLQEVEQRRTSKEGSPLSLPTGE